MGFLPQEFMQEITWNGWWKSG